MVLSFFAGLKAWGILLVIEKKKPSRQLSVQMLPGILLLSIFASPLPWEHFKWVSYGRRSSFVIL